MYLKLFKIASGTSPNGGSSNTTCKCFTTVGATEFTLTHDSGFTDLPLPQQTAEQNTLIKLLGEKESYSIGFTLSLSNVDLSRVKLGDSTTNTNSSWGGARNLTTTPITVLEQITHLNDILVTEESSDEFGFWLIDTPSNIETIMYERSPRITSQLPYDGTVVSIANGGLFSNLSISYRMAAEAADVRVTFTLGVVST